MPLALEGSQALARAVGLCRPQVIAAYPITPQTHIVENLSKLIADGDLDAELVSVESEFSAASVALGAAAAGSRAFTASASQGILLMTEVLYDIAGLRVPLVMICANRAVSAPLSIWNDQQDSMSVRDAGWIQLYCADNQEAVDTVIQAYRIAERTQLPVMVCVDGFTLTHTLEPITLPTQADVDSFLPAYRFDEVLHPASPRTLGALVSPDYYSEARYLHHAALLASAAEVMQADADWSAASGRTGGGLVAVEGGSDARVGVVCLGAIFGTLAAARERLDEPDTVRLIRVRCFRPFPARALAEACAGLDTVIVLERALSPGAGGIVSTELQSALAGMATAPAVHGFAVGLGGRDVGIDILARALAAAESGDGTFAILDIEAERLPAEKSA